MLNQLWTYGSLECAYCVTIMLICLKVLLIFIIESLLLVSKLFINGMCVVALAPATKTMSGAMFHPLVVMLLMSGWFFVFFQSRAFVANMSLQYVNSMNCMVHYSVGASSGGWLYGWPMMHSMSDLNLALQWTPYVHNSTKA